MADTASSKPGQGVSPTTYKPGEAGQDIAEQVPGANDQERPKEIGGRAGPEPTRYGDWEKNGRCIDF
ncbi:MAG: DUF1674 domain-containing protein [Pseudomonadota bacterium]